MTFEGPKACASLALLTIDVQVDQKFALDWVRYKVVGKYTFKYIIFALFDLWTLDGVFNDPWCRLCDFLSLRSIASLKTLEV